MMTKNPTYLRKLFVASALSLCLANASYSDDTGTVTFKETPAETFTETPAVEDDANAALEKSRQRMIQDNYTLELLLTYIDEAEICSPTPTGNVDIVRWARTLSNGRPAGAKYLDRSFERTIEENPRLDIRFKYRHWVSELRAKHGPAFVSVRNGIENVAKVKALQDVGLNDSAGSYMTGSMLRATNPVCYEKVDSLSPFNLGVCVDLDDDKQGYRYIKNVQPPHKCYIK